MFSVKCTLLWKVSVTIFGPALAYGLGGVFRQLYVTLEGECNYIFGPVLAYGLGGVFSQMYITLEGWY